MSETIGDSPVRGMVTMREYLRVVRENEDLRAYVEAHKIRNRPVLLAHEIEPGSIKRPRRRGPSHKPIAPGSIMARCLETLRRGTRALTTRDIADRIGERSAIVAPAMYRLARKRLAERVDAGFGKGVAAYWRATPQASQPKE